MRDLDELFATLDRVPAPQLRERIRSSQAHVEPPIPPLGSARSRKIGTIAVALLIFLLPALYAWQSTARAAKPVGRPSRRRPAVLYRERVDGTTASPRARQRNIVGLDWYTAHQLGRLRD